MVVYLKCHTRVVVEKICRCQKSLRDTEKFGFPEFFEKLSTPRPGLFPCFYPIFPQGDDKGFFSMRHKTFWLFHHTYGLLFHTVIHILWITTVHNSTFCHPSLTNPYLPTTFQRHRDDIFPFFPFSRMKIGLF